jgi:hypothetical protein
MDLMEKSIENKEKSLRINELQEKQNDRLILVAEKKQIILI